MHLDGLTLMVAECFVTAVCAILVLSASTQMRSPALVWWAASGATYSFGIGLIAYSMGTGNRPMIGVAAGFITLGPMLLWCGARRFNHRKQALQWLIPGPLIWLAAGLVAFPGVPEGLSQAVGFMVAVAYLAAAAAELWRGRSESLAARWPLLGFIALHAFIFVGGAFDALAGNMPAGVIPPLTSWFSLIHFETLIFAVGTSVFMVLMCKERSERRHIIAARYDSLTGIANRGAFLEAAQRALRRCQSDGTSFSLILFDLDRFKRINDTFGHEAGDDVLRRFAATARAVLRPNDIFGRYGGEEFAVALPAATIEAAYVIAERIRHKFGEACAFLGERQLNATVSAGVAAATSTTTLETIIRAADESMYEAKSLGRNRVERAARDTNAEIKALIRIA